MKEPEIYLNKNGEKIKGHTLDLGEWDIAEGFSTTIFMHNPNTHAKGILTALKNQDERVTVKCADELLPLETISIRITIPPHEYAGEEEEKEYFVDLIDSLAGRIKWVRP
jgi:hypothetical protein